MSTIEPPITPGESRKATFAGPGEMRARCRDLDWSATPLGAVEGWPQSLRTAASLVLGSGFASALYVGREAILIYNDAWAALIGTSHPRALGRSSFESFAERRGELEPRLRRVWEGETLFLTDVRLAAVNNGDDRWFTISYAPLRDEQGAVIAAHSITVETTEARRVEGALREGETRLRLAIDVAELGTWSWDLVTGAGELDARGAQLIGLQAGPLADVATAQMSVIHPEDVERTRRAAEAGVASGAPFDLDYRVIHPDGSVHYISSRARVVTDDDGRPVRLVGTNRDATAERIAAAERERLLAATEAALAAADFERRQLETVLEHLPIGVTLAEAPSGKLLVSNRAVRQIWGLDTPAAAVAHYSRLYVGYRPGTDHRYESHEWPLARALMHGEEVRDELVEIERPDGTRRIASITAAPVRDAAGKILAAIVMTLDVTDRERARAEAEASGTRAQALLDSIGDAFYLLDRDWRFVHVNAAAEPLLRRTREQLVGRTVWEEFPEAVGSPFDDAFREALATNRVTFVEAFFPPLDSWFDVRVYPWEGGLMVYFRNVNDRKAAEAEREQLLTDAQSARAEAEAANRAKSEFLAVMSHELRTPLNAIGGYAELLEMGIRGAVTAQQRADLHRIQMSQRHLLGLINEVLNYAKLETGSVHYAMAEVVVRDALGEAEGLVMPQARARGLTLAVAPCPETTKAHADAEKLRQVLLNLLSNAVKFTDAGGRVDVECEEEREVVRIRVRDSGIGIHAEKLDAIFEPFVQVRSDLTRTAEGVGLGLAISKDLARGMGGDLTVESELGRGSTFTLTLARVE
ncbi:MAG TPA: PAS domain-containing protein [Gemmatimonadaceae bacterium]|nr:PAS domain-containing protein [Gemmatimonadaceae bacterium]